MADAAYHRAWRERHRESCRRSARECARRRRAAGLHLESQKRFGESLKGVLSAYRSNARKRGIEFALDPLLVDDLTTDSCYYCGAPPAPRNGIDRADNARGYVEGNVVTACSLCNRLKRADSMENFIGHAKLIAARFA